MKLFKIIPLFIFLISTTPTIIICQEDPQQFNDKIVTTHDNFAEKYPELAQGFQVIGKDFQTFMLNNLLGHYPYEKTLSNEQETSRLDKTLQQAEEIISESAHISFYNSIFFAIENDTKLNDISDPIFTYVLRSPILEKSISLYIQPEDDEDNLLITATMKNNPEIVQFLLDLGADTSKTSRINKQTALHLAVKNNYFDLVSMLINAPSTDINQKNWADQTALHLAVIYKKNKIAKLLLKHPSIEIDPIDNNETTPLGYAMDRGNLSIVQQLINAGADINLPGIENWTPLHQAVDENNLKIASCLLDAGARKDMYTVNNETALDLAQTVEMRSLLSKKRKRDVESASENS